MLKILPHLSPQDRMFIRGVIITWPYVRRRYPTNFSESDLALSDANKVVSRLDWFHRNFERGTASYAEELRDKINRILTEIANESPDR